MPTPNPRRSNPATPPAARKTTARERERQERQEEENLRAGFYGRVPRNFLSWGEYGGECGHGDGGVERVRVNGSGYYQIDEEVN